MTITTIGYGDIVVFTLLSRLMMILLAFISTIFISLLIYGFNKHLRLTEMQLKTFDMIERVNLFDKVTHLGRECVQSFI